MLLLVINSSVSNIYLRGKADVIAFFSNLVTLKKAPVDPDPTQPYLILVCFAKSSADSIGDSIRSTVKKAARFAVYEDIIISVKNHHKPATIRVDIALKLIRMVPTFLPNKFLFIFIICL